MKDWKVTLTLLEPILGTCSANPELYEEFIASRNPAGADGAEVESLPVQDLIDKGTTVFHRLPDGRPCVYDYVFKGFCKDACGMLRRAKDTKSTKLKAYKKEIDGLIFVTPRMIPIVLPDGGEMGISTRPLRAQTAQGERVSLARSETCPAGSTLTFDVTLLSETLAPLVEEWLTYGKLRGLGQWRNAGFGRFEYTME